MFTGVKLLMPRGLRKTKKHSIPSDWRYSLVSDIATTYGGTTPSTTEPTYWDDGCNLWATPTDITSLNSKYISDTERKITDKAFNETSLKTSPPGTILMTSRATIGLPAIAQNPIATNQGFINIECQDNTVNHYVYYWIVQNRDLLKRFSQGSTFLELSKKDFRKFYCAIPPLPEQRKIAEILTTVDDAIAKTDAILKETQELKKGLTQKLFTEGIGHTRFKETKIGRIPESWNILQLSNIVKSGKPITYGIVQAGAHTPGGIPYIRSGDLNGNLIVIENLLRTSETIANKYFRSEVKPGDIVFSLRGNIGETKIVPFSLERANLTQGTARISCAERFNNEYINYALHSPPLIKRIKAVVKGSTFVEITLGDLRKLKIPIPPLSERQKIASILSKVDTKIENEQATKSELEELKRGLSQVLLTGQIRVKV